LAGIEACVVDGRGEKDDDPHDAIGRSVGGGVETFFADFSPRAEDAWLDDFVALDP
jgi:hypothetical protein